MRWMTRLVVFLLFITAGESTLYIVAQKKEASTQSEEKAAETSDPQLVLDEPLETAPDEASQSIKFGPVAPLEFYANREKIILRENPDPGSRVVAKLTAGGYERAEIIEATKDFLRVRFVINDDSANDETKREKSLEGWVSWGEVQPYMSAIVLDAETGEVISRIPLREGLTSIAFSQDNSRAIFFSGEGGTAQTAYEVQTSDYTLTRSLISSGEEYLGNIFYGPESGSLYTTLHRAGQSHGGTDSKMSLLRIGDEGAPNEIAPVRFEKGDIFVVSPDGSAAFILRRETEDASEITVHKFELTTQQILSSFTLNDTPLDQGLYNFAMSRDGSEFYLRQSENMEVITVIDTRTGRPLRVIPYLFAGDGWSVFSQDDLVGDSLHVRIWEQSDDEMHANSENFWVSGSGRVPAEGGIAYVTEGDGRRFAVNEAGTHLFKLNDKNQIEEKLWIERLDLIKGSEEETGLTVFGLKASPDGKRIILFLGIEHGC
ncbi:MAG TPA: SH3 domain-containing protein [Pyrinomonadaceae bacterium]